MNFSNGQRLRLFFPEHVHHDLDFRSAGQSREGRHEFTALSDMVGSGCDDPARLRTQRAFVGSAELALGCVGLTQAFRDDVASRERTATMSMRKVRGGRTEAALELRNKE